MLGHSVLPPQLPIYDISVPIHPRMPLYPGSPPVSFKQVESVAAGAPATVFQVCMGTHTGTHLDAPFHVTSSGTRLSDIDLQLLVGPCQVVELDVGEAITARDLRVVHWDEARRLLLKTRNSNLWDGTFHTDFAYLTEDAARLIASHDNVRLVGIDYLSVDSADSVTLNVHHILLDRGICVLEGLNLYGITPGQYELIFLPLSLETGDGAPGRAILRG